MQTNNYQNIETVRDIPKEHMKLSYFAYPGVGRLIRNAPDRSEAIKIITSAACKKFGIKPEDIMERTRRRQYVLSRQSIMHVMSTKLKMNLTEIGRHFNLDHTTIIHGLKNISGRIDTEPDMKQTIEHFKMMI